MANNTTPRLSDVIRQADRWLYYTFDENYTARSADRIYAAALESMPENIPLEDRESLAIFFRKSGTGVLFREFFSQQHTVILGAMYDHAKGIGLAAGTDTSNPYLAKERVGLAIDSLIAVGPAIRVIDRLRTRPSFADSDIASAFVSEYASPEDIVRWHVNAIEFSIYSNSHGHVSPHTASVDRSAGAHYRARSASSKDVTTTYPEEFLRLHRHFLPVVAKEAFSPLYRTGVVAQDILTRN